MSWAQNVRDAHEQVRDVEQQMADDAASRKAEGRPFVEDARYRELNGQMETAMADRRAAWLGREPHRNDEPESER